jgi:hypothetical protein
MMSDTQDLRKDQTYRVYDAADIGIAIRHFGVMSPASPRWNSPGKPAFCGST